uniref:Metalloendopeptidase n=1 Tax=Steinernema glaseri TaxID=37863 RepID=A0A1I7ZX31_9BILA
IVHDTPIIPYKAGAKINQQMSMYQHQEPVSEQAPEVNPDNVIPDIPSIPQKPIVEINKELSEYLHQGDIIENEEHLETRLGYKRFKRNTINALEEKGLVWETDKPIPYTIDAAILPDGVNAIHEALKFWSDNTCLSFKENGSAEGTTLMRFINGGGCYSSVGKQYKSSSQTVSIGPGCVFLGIAAHEIGHALGMWHTQSRYDRDDFVTVSNVNPTLMFNYVKETPSENYNHKVRYDYGSIMHYEPSSFALDKSKPTLLSKDAGYQKTMGQRVIPAFSDVWLINLQHNCLVLST